jgi:NAD(P)-dependent dehydrogenase (short-subunit alcohol dehydrogenase family)
MAQANLTAKNLFSFDHHVALITGGASGLGEMAAEAFVQNGAKVFIASRKESELKKVRKCYRGTTRRVADGRLCLVRGETQWHRTRKMRVHRRRPQGQSRMREACQ